jgi:hypothetical protein
MPILEESRTSVLQSGLALSRMSAVRISVRKLSYVHPAQSTCKEVRDNCAHLHKRRAAIRLLFVRFNVNVPEAELTELRRE